MTKTTDLPFELKPKQMYKVKLGYSGSFVVNVEGLKALLTFLDHAEYLDDGEYISGEGSNTRIMPAPESIINIHPYDKYPELKNAQVLNIGLIDYRRSLKDDTDPVSE